MKYYIVNSEGKEVSFDLSTGSKKQGKSSFSVSFAAEVKKHFFIKSIGGKDFVSEDEKTWRKLPGLSRKDGLVYFNESIKVYRGFKPSGLTAAKAGNLITEMPGKVVKVLTTKGAMVSEGDTLVILEAMKMENEIKADVSGIVQSINVEENETVESGQLLVEIEK